MKICMLTTKDNPYDPIKDFGAWFTYDSIRYNTCGLIASYMPMSTDIPYPLYNYLYQGTLERIVEEDLTNNYVIVYGEDESIIQ